ncbi:hypothetical protein CLU79DRAFT_836095 [Phycomyces nitens]|nr:hypothetical protein CLU79DRAFT_836095 [Phycomyces nitens]
MPTTTTTTVTAAATATTPTTPTTTITAHVSPFPAPVDVVDDAELLAILGLPFLFEEDLTSLAALDWDDMPELSEEEDDDCASLGGKRRRQDDDDDLFAQLDFIDVPFPAKKQCFVEDDDVSLEKVHTQVVDEEDIRLALDLISS